MTLQQSQFSSESYKPREISKIDADIFRELIFSKRLLIAGPKKIHFFQPNSSHVIEKKFSFSLKVGQQKVDLDIELKPESPLVRRLDEVGGLESLPKEFEVALTTYASREIIEVLQHLFELPVAIWDTATETEEACEKKELYFEILNEHAVCESRATIKISLSLIERILDVAKKIPMSRSRSVEGSIIQGEALIGSATMSLGDWKSLQPGDLIVIQEPSTLTTGEGRCLIKKSGIIPVMLKPDLFKSLILPLEKLFPAGLKPVSPVSKEEGKEEKSTDSSIPLELNFSAGVLSLTIEEAIQLEKTKSIQKSFHVSRPLKIFIEEQTVGTGELVKINERYAIVVNELYSQH